MIKKTILFALVLMSISCENRKEQDSGVLLKQIDSLMHDLAEVYKPGFGELMGSIQTHHIKLWLGGINENWQLAEFEIHEINEILDDLKKYQSLRKETKLLGMIIPNIEKVKSAVKSQSINTFKQEYINLTKACNDCHIDTRYEFIKITVPDRNPFSNQKF